MRITDYEIHSWNGASTQVKTSSGNVYMQNMPNRALLYMTPAELDDQHRNPFNFLKHNLTEVSIDINGRVRQIMIDPEKRYFITQYSDLVRCMAPSSGKFAVAGRPRP